MQGDSDKIESFQDALEQLSSLRRFTGPPAVFWQSYLDAMVTICDARCGLIVRQRKEAGRVSPTVQHPGAEDDGGEEGGREARQARHGGDKGGQ